MTSSKPPVLASSVREAKLKRLTLIARILSERDIASQVELADQLERKGIKADQATISRDLDELGASLIRKDDGAQVYVLEHKESAAISPRPTIDKVLNEHAMEIKRSGDIIIVKTPPAAAELVAYAIDRAHIEKIMGTVAGDDTVAVFTETGQGARVVKQLSVGLQEPAPKKKRK